MARDTLATYSDTDATTNASEFAPGDTIYFEGDITSLNATTDSAVKVEIYDEATDTLQATALTTTKSFVANTLTTLYSINSDARVSWVTTSNTTVGEYYAKLTVGAEVLYIGFKISGTPTTIAFTTTEDFDTGTHAGTSAQNDNLYAGIVEEFDDDVVLSSLTEVIYDAGSAITIADGVAHIDADTSGTRFSGLVSTSSLAFSTLKKIKATMNNIRGGATDKTSVYIMAKETIPTGATPGTEIAKLYHYVYLNGSLYTHKFCARVRNTDGTFRWYRSGVGWVDYDLYTPYYTYAYSAYDAYPSIRFEYTCDGTNLTFTFRDYDTDEVLASVSYPVADIYTGAGTALWAVVGAINASSDTDVDDIQIISSPITWTSPAITPPTDKKLKTLTITLSNGEESVNYIDKVEALNASSSAVIDTAAANKHATVTYTGSDFENTLDPTFNTAFKLKVYLNNLGTTVLTIASIEGTFENLATFRFDGEVFVQ